MAPPVLPRDHACFGKETIMAQKGAGGNPGAITEKGGDGAGGSTGTGRGGGNNARGKRSTAPTKGNDKRHEEGKKGD